jgi:dethiobiotin synthetase
MTLVVVSGLGTDIGKTHVAAALALRWGRDEPVFAYKPIESGVTGGPGPDEATLAAYSTFHVKHPPLQLRLRAGVSPHLAARLESTPIDLDTVTVEVARLCSLAHVIVELPGGLFSPLSDTATNADLAARLRPDALFLVAANRLGVLHDARATYEACRARRLGVDGLILNAIAIPDASSSTNAAELVLTSGLPLLADLPRAPIRDLVARGALDGLVRYCRGGIDR